MNNTSNNSEKNHKTVIVTGGAGFIGSHLCEALVKDPTNRVISLDNYFTGSRDNHIEGVEYREGHTRDIERHIPETPDIIYHLGEYSRVEKSFEDPFELIWDLNVAGTFSILEFCKMHNCKLVYAGSSTKFSKNDQGKNESPYSWSKASNSELVKNFGDWYGLNYAITYFYNVYGPREISCGPYSTVIGIFREEHQRGLPITVTAPGTQTRNFTHVEDIVNGLILVGEKGRGDNFGIGSEQPYSILDIANMFGSEIVMMPERKGNRKGSEIDTSKIRSLGWEQKRDVETHIKEVVEKTKEITHSEKRILVFSTTFFPFMGLAEESLCDVMRSMPDIHFDIITSKFSKETRNDSCPVSNATVHYVGGGSFLDKYLLPILGFKKAKELRKQHNYMFLWALLASYAALTAVLFRHKHKNDPLLVTLADQRIEGIPFYFSLPLRFVLSQADQISTITAEQEKGVSRVAPHAQLTASNRAGDAFANQVRFMYNAFLKERQNRERG